MLLEVLAQHLQYIGSMARGQSSVEYLLVTTILVLGLVAIFSLPAFVGTFANIYREVAYRVGSDAMTPSP